MKNTLAYCDTEDNAKMVLDHRQLVISLPKQKWFYIRGNKLDMYKEEELPFKEPWYVLQMGPMS